MGWLAAPQVISKHLRRYTSQFSGGFYRPVTLIFDLLSTVNGTAVTPAVCPVKNSHRFVLSKFFCFRPVRDRQTGKTHNAAYQDGRIINLCSFYYVNVYV